MKRILIVDDRRNALLKGWLQMTKKILVTSSRNDIWCDVNGNVLETTSTEHLIFKQFNFEECDAFWGNSKRQDVYNILDLGGIKTDGTCFSPNYGARNDMLIKCPKWLTINLVIGKGER